VGLGSSQQQVPAQTSIRNASEKHQSDNDFVKTWEQLTFDRSFELVTFSLLQNNRKSNFGGGIVI